MSYFLVIDSNKVICSATDNIKDAQHYLKNVWYSLENETAKIVELKKRNNLEDSLAK